MHATNDPNIVTSTLENRGPETRDGSTRLDIKYAANLVARYFKADPVAGTCLVLGYVALLGGGSFLLLRSQEHLASLTNALAAKNAEPIAALALVILATGLTYLLSHLLADLFKYLIRIRARGEYSRQFIDRWTTDNRFHRLEQDGKLDHPEQRIQEDVYVFIEHMISLGPGLIASMAPMLLYSDKLWGLSQPVTLSFFTIKYELHGSLFFAAAGFAILWTCVTHLLGSGLTRSEVIRQKLEARFRHEMAWLRENSEAIAFERGSQYERARLNDTFSLIRENWRKYTRAHLQIAFCVGLPPMIFMVVPALLCAPYVLDGRMQIGDIQLVGMSFQIVYMSFGVLIQSYDTIAILRSAVARLRYFDEQLALPSRSDIEHSAVQQDGVTVENLRLCYPDGRPMLSIEGLAINPGSRLLITGESGSGKSTLLRSLAGLWPSGNGEIRVPESAKICFLPQRAYLPEGSLAMVLCYPTPVESVDESLLRELLDRMGLSSLSARLDEHANWRRTLSPGEQQRIAAIRAIINAPDFLFIDEATSALDARSEATLYALLDEYLPSSSAIISVAHRPAVAAFHTSRLQVVDGHAVESTLQPTA